VRWALIVGAVLLCCCCYRWVLYHRRFRFVLQYKQDLLVWLGTGDGSASDRLSEGALYARELLTEARVGIALPRVEPLGLSQIATMHLRPLDRVRTRDAEVANLNISGLEQAQGYFKRRRNQSFDPMFWIDYVIRLPAHAFPLLEKGPEVVKQIIQLLWYATVLYGAYQVGTRAALIDALKQLIQPK
jgi:hypothetical protein